MTKSNNIKIKIIDYKAGNAPSVLSAAKHLGYDAELAHNPEEMKGATHIILPGVGSAGATMRSLGEASLIGALEHAVLKQKTKFLGICVGMQILFGHSEEEDTHCLGWLDGNVMRFDSTRVKVPQMGWNAVRFMNDAQVVGEAPPENNASALEDYFYFVNSYYVVPANKRVMWGLTDYGGEFVSAIRHDNIYATQFHIEKSGSAGLKLLDGFLRAGTGGDAIC